MEAGSEESSPSRSPRSVLDSGVGPHLNRSTTELLRPSSPLFPLGCATRHRPHQQPFLWHGPGAKGLPHGAASRHPEHPEHLAALLRPARARPGRHSRGAGQSSAATRPPSALRAGRPESAGRGDALSRPPSARAGIPHPRARATSASTIRRARPRPAPRTRSHPGPAWQRDDA